MCRPGKKAGLLLLVLGLLILLSLILPSGFLWFLLGAALILIGAVLLRRRN